MTITLRIILLISSVCTLMFFLQKIRKAKIQVDDALFWIITSFAFIVLSIFPQILNYFSRILGFQSPANLLFVCIISVLLIYVFTLSIRIAKLQDRLDLFGQQYALNELHNEKTVKPDAPVRSSN